LAGVGRFEGVDIEKVRTELSVYVEQTTPRNTSGPGYVSMTNVPACGRAEAIRLSERIRPILDRLYPTWHSDTEANKYFEFAQERDGAMRLIAQLDSLDEIEEMLAGYDASPVLTGSQLYPLVWTAASAQWSTGHRQEAVLAAAKAVNSMLQDKLDRRDVSDVKLVREAFSEKDPEPDRPRLRFPYVEDEQTRESMRQGAMAFGAGCFQAIRNPVGHLPNEEHELTEQEALERLAAFSLLARWIQEATLEGTEGTLRRATST
jgi:hypothetical protein